ncbi:MAG: ribosome recycling factor [Finegoldia sp.]|nr:ribosome recycling factor [Finegoldia sp.]
MSDDILDMMKDKSGKTLEALKEQLKTVRAGRANPSILDKITVEYYGTKTPLNQVATISAPEARLLVIQPWDKSIIPAIEKQIMESNLGITPSNDGNLIRLPFPQLTEERRKELTKVVKDYGETAKVSIRSLRRDAIDAIKKQEKSSDITEDDSREMQDDIQKMTDKFTAEIDAIVKEKEDELMEI